MRKLQMGIYLGFRLEQYGGRITATDMHGTSGTPMQFTAKNLPRILVQIDAYLKELPQGAA